MGKVANIDVSIEINKKQAEQIAILQQQVEYLKRQLYGRKSEEGIDYLDLFKDEDLPKRPHKRPKEK
ncbi:hypothetical protein OAN94_05520 [Verrucomicrobiales bacterium]|nr:hypothetical protein [Verrucomicrobiales bacterium]MDA7643811.1 hypothetical protein [Verrucomicrobiales bacterium]MDB4772592.1 hypothetical protein [Verrucomicrobiales bacterium]MDC0312576.1 hypothetical protein [Verrucomicrobiales bacterium]MDC0503716.1 hypothetical protein [Verrucomicrobiales bacterium]